MHTLKLEVFQLADRRTGDGNSTMKESYWKKKVVLVTGGSSGLGLEIVTAFAEKGAQVVIAALEKEAVESVVQNFQSKGLDVIGFQVNVCADEDVQRLKEEIQQRFGRLDVLANVAGRTDRGKMIQCDADHFAKVMNLNFIALVRVTHTFLPMLLESRGHLINIGSLASKSASRWTGAYPSSKHAVAAYSQQLRLEHREDGLKVLLVCPGPIQRETERLYPLEGLEDLPESARRPGAGVKVSKISPQMLVDSILKASEKGQIELVLPKKARLLFTISQLCPKLGDWLVLKNT